MLTLMQMLEAGVQFGHKKERSHPKTKNYTFAIREGIFVIDLEKTQNYLLEAISFLKKEISLGKTILFVGTKRQAKDLLKKTAEDMGMPYVNKRFLGGTLTNFETIKKNIMQIENLENKIKGPEFETLIKKEKKIITDKYEKLLATFSGIRDMKRLPDALFIIDAGVEKVAVNEANKMEIPVVAITDTDVDPDKIAYIIPANDDAPKSIELMLNAVKEGIKSEKSEIQSTKFLPADATHQALQAGETNNKIEKTQKISKTRTVKNSSTKLEIKEKK